MVFTNSGRNLIVSWLSGGGTVVNPIAMTMGSGTTAAYVTDIKLDHEVGSVAGNAGSIWRISPLSAVSTADLEVHYEGVFTSIVGSNTIFSEIGLFNNGSYLIGSVFARATFTPTQKTINEEWDTLYYIKLG
jgi:hypothetical protein